MRLRLICPFHSLEANVLEKIPAYELLKIKTQSTPSCSLINWLHSWAGKSKKLGHF